MKRNTDDDGDRRRGDEVTTARGARVLGGVITAGLALGAGAVWYVIHRRKLRNRDVR